MKKSTRIILAISAIVIITVLYVREHSVPVAGSTGPESATVPAAPSAAAGSSPGPIPALLPAPAESVPGNSPPNVPPLPPLPPLPHTIKDLNQLADGPLPLSVKMAVLAKLMMEAPPEQAKAAAVRSVFIVRNGDYTTQLQPLLVAGALKPEALEVLSLNLYDRPLEIQLPALAAIRDQSGHPLQQMAADALIFHLKDKGHASGAALARSVKDYLSPPPP